MFAALLFVVAAICFGITLSQAIKKVPHTKNDGCKTNDPHGRGKHIDFYV